MVSTGVSPRAKKAARTFGAHLAALRRKRGLTQSELASAAGISIWMVVGYEVRDANPRIAVLPRLARALGVTVDTLVGDSDTAMAPVAPPRRKKKPATRTELQVAKEAADGLGRRLAQLRKARGLTQQELGDTVGVSNRVIAYYELENGNPPVAGLVRLAKALAVTVDELVGHRPATTTAAPRSLNISRRLHALEQLPDRQRRQALHVLDALIDREQSKSKNGR